MNKHIRSWLAGTTMLVMTATGAFAEVVFNRGNSADPESLDPHKTSTVYEANILRDLFTGLDGAECQGRSRSPAPPKAGPCRQMARSTPSSCAPTASGRTDRRSPPMISSSPGSAWSIPATAAEYAYMLAPVVNAEDITAGKKKPEELGVKAVDDTTFEVHAQCADALLPRDADPSGDLSGQQGQCRRSSAPTSSSPAIWSRTAPTRWPSSCPTITSSWSRIPTSIDAANVKIDVVNYIPTEDRSTAMKRFEAGELDIERRYPDRAARRSEGQVRRPGPDRALSRHLLLRLQDRQGAVGQRRSSATPSPWRSTATISPRRSGRTP